MLASDFLALCETAWPEANLRIAKILGHKMRTREGGIATTDGAGILHSCPYYVDESIDHRADADLAREVEDALFKLADEKDLGLTGFRDQEYKDVNGKWTCFIRFQLALRARDGDTIMMVFASNKSWLMAAALVELTTERK